MEKILESFTTATPDQAAEKICIAVKNLLCKFRLNGGEVPRQAVSHLLPDTSSTPAQMETWKQLFSNPMIVSDEDLHDILGLELSTETSAPTMPGYHFYLHSWTFSLTELEKVIANMLNSDQNYMEMIAWLNVIRLSKETQGTKKFVVRYFGTCKGPEKPGERLQKDLCGRDGLLSVFMKCVRSSFPERSPAPKTFLLRKASLPCGKPSLSQDIMMFLIILFDYPTLLNRAGIEHVIHLPDSDKREAFGKLGTDFHQEFLRNGCMNSALSLKIDRHFRRVQQWAQANPAAAGTHEYAFTESFRKLITQQATPLQHWNTTLLVWVGNDVTANEYLGSEQSVQKGWIEGGSRSGSLARVMFESLCGEEWAAYRRHEWKYKNFRVGEVFCFVNLWCTLLQQDIDIALKHFKEYLQLVHPLIVATFSRTVWSWTKSDLRFQCTSSACYLSHVGTLTFQQYDWDDTEATFIYIPHLDPAWDRHGGETEVLRDIMDYTMQVTFVLAEEAMRILQRLDKMRDQELSRLHLCQLIKARFDVRMSYGAGLALKTALEEAKHSAASHGTIIQGHDNMIRLVNGAPSVDARRDQRGRM